MKGLPLLIAASALTLGAAGEVAYAQQGLQGHQGQQQGMMGPGMMGPGMMMGDQSDSYLAYAKTQIGLEASQEQAWNAYITAIHDAAQTMADYRQTMMTAHMQGQMSMPDMQAQMLTFMEARTAAAKDINKAAKALYEKLTPQQRTIADRVLPQGMGMMW